jgi:hypothetical protein
LTLNHWKKAAIKSGISVKKFEGFDKKYISNEKFKENIKNL